MNELVALLVSGAVAGGIYALFASGLVLTYDTSGVFDFAHGAVAYVCAVVFFCLHSPDGAGWPVLPTALVTVLVVGPTLGWLFDRLMFRALARAPENARIIGTIGLMVALPALTRGAVAVATEQGASLPDLTTIVSAPGLGPSPAKVWNPLAMVAIDSDQVAVFVAAAAAAVGLWMLLRRTRLGLATRAAVDERDLAGLRGVDVDRISTVAWMLGFALAGVTGVLIAPLFQLDPGIFTLLLVGSFTAVVFARFRSYPLAFAGGLAVGVVQNLVYGYAPGFLTRITGLQSAIPFLLLLAVVVWRGRSQLRPAGSRVRERPPPTRRERPGWARLLPWAVAAVALLAALTTLDRFWTGLLAKGLVFGLIFLSFVVVTGLGGVVSLAQAAFVTIAGLSVGALTTNQLGRTVPVLMNNGRFSFLAAAVVGVVLAVGAGVLVALPSLRIGGLAFAISTLALALIGETIVFRSDAVANGSRGWVVRAPSLGPFDLSDSRTMAVVAFVLAVAVSAGIVVLRASRLGRAALAVRGSEVAARSVGLSPIRTRTTVFAISAAIAAVGGALLAPITSPFTPSTTPALAGLVWLAAVATFGIRRPGAAVAAGVVYALFPQVLAELASASALEWLPTAVRAALASPYLPEFLFGLGAIGYARDPEGLVHTIARRRARRRRVAAPSAPGAALALSEVHAGYDEREVLEAVTIRVDPGTAIAIVGPNGAGKSTVCRVAGGVLEPSSGRVEIGGRDVTGATAATHARAGCYVVPEHRAVFTDLTVDENLRLAVPSAADRDALYDRVPLLAERRTTRAGSLSGGEQRLLGVAPVLAAPLRVVVADEPTLGLAPVSAAAVLEQLAGYHAGGGTLVVAMERAGELPGLAQRALVMRSGRVVDELAVDDATVARLTGAYLGEPG